MHRTTFLTDTLPHNPCLPFYHLSRHQDREKKGQIVCDVIFLFGDEIGVIISTHLKTHMKFQLGGLKGSCCRAVQ